MKDDAKPANLCCGPEPAQPEWSLQSLEGAEADEQLAKLAKAIGHPARVHILRMLSRKEARVCSQIVDELPLAQSTVSEHLRILKDAGLVRSTQDGPRIGYCINFDGLAPAESSRSNHLRRSYLRERFVHAAIANRRCSNQRQPVQNDDGLRQEGEEEERESMTPRHFNVLFLCTHNSARSIMAEAIMSRKGFPNFSGYSAGSHPTGRVSPHALKQVAGAGMPIEGLRSKSWDEFGKPDAPEIHFVFTVCDREVAEPCPVWPGQPLTAQWSVPDPATATGTEDQIQRAYFDASEFWIAGSLCLFLCRWQRWNGTLSSERSIKLAGASRSVFKRTLNVLTWVLIALLVAATLWAVLWAARQPKVHSIWGEAPEKPLT